MKTISFRILIIILLGSLLNACDKKETLSTPPELPPVESMVIDFGQLTTKSAELSKVNWAYSVTTVGFWNIILGTTLAVPVAAFHAAFNHQPTQIDDLTWQWQYNVDGFASTYSARLVGKLQSNQIKWEMYIAKTGINPFDEFLWFEGTSNLDGNSGQWILYHSAEFQDKFLQIDWQKEGESIGQIMYTYIREKNDQNMTDVYNGSTLTYGLQEGELDAYVNVHIYDMEKTDFTNASIEWSRANYNGHVRAEQYFNDSDWHCWDSEGNDVDCN